MSNLYARSLGDSPEPRLRPFGLGISISFDGPIRRVMIFLCLTAGGIRFLVLPVPARALGLPYSWLTAEPRQTLAGLLRPAYLRCERVGCPLYCGDIWCPGIQSYRLNIIMKENTAPSSLSLPHRLYHPRSDDQFSRSLVKDSLSFTRPLFS
jgi:hypothetical protein